MYGVVRYGFFEEQVGQVWTTGVSRLLLVGWRTVSRGRRCRRRRPGRDARPVARRPRLGGLASSACPRSSCMGEVERGTLSPDAPPGAVPGPPKVVKATQSPRVTIEPSSVFQG